MTVDRDLVVVEPELYVQRGELPLRTLAQVATRRVIEDDPTDRGRA